MAFSTKKKHFFTEITFSTTKKQLLMKKYLLMKTHFSTKDYFFY